MLGDREADRNRVWERVRGRAGEGIEEGRGEM